MDVISYRHVVSLSACKKDQQLPQVRRDLSKLKYIGIKMVISYSHSYRGIKTDVISYRHLAILSACKKEQQLSQVRRDLLKRKYIGIKTVLSYSQMVILCGGEKGPQPPLVRRDL